MKIMFLLTAILIAGFSAYGQNDEYHGSFFEDFKRPRLKHFRYGSTGKKSDFKWRSGVKSTTEPGTKILSFKIDPSDSAGAGRGPEIISKKFTHFGTYAARLKIPDTRNIQPNVGAVIGYFTYNMEKGPGLSEIDYEWLLADPEIIYIGTWTGSEGELQRIGRVLNLAKGSIYSTTFRTSHNGKRTPLTGLQNEPGSINAIEGYDASKQFYTYGFDWFPDRIRWWMLTSTADTLVLWDYRGSTIGIPQNHTYYRMNFWHTNNWPVETNPASIEKPLEPYELEVDWMSYKSYGK
jgi:hypothetical protein